MAKVAIMVDEEEVPLIEALLLVRRELRTPYAQIVVHHIDGVTKDLEVTKRLRIADFHKKIRAT